MIAHTHGFKTAMSKLGRDIEVLIDYYAVVYNLKTENDKLLITQDNAELLTEEMPTQDPTSHLTNEDIITLNRNNLGELFRTYMKSFDLETTHKFNVGDKMIIKVGTTVNGEIEYLNYGLYYVYQRTYSEDSKTYTYTLCDRMLFTMQKYDNDTCFGNNTQLTCKQLIMNILTNICGFDNNTIELNDTHLVNKDKIIYKDTFSGADMTCRDVLDMIIQVQGCSLVIGYEAENEKDYICTKKISTSSVDTIDADILNDKNIDIGKKYGKLNSLLFSRANGVDNIERKNSESIEEYGETQYVIENNYILDQDNRESYIDNLFLVMNGLEYYICDIEIKGLGYIEYLDRFKINTGENIYNTICLQNTSNINNGMKEHFKTQELLETKQKFENIGMTDKEASVVVNKLKGEIVLKTYVDEEDGKTKIAQVRLDSSGDEGSLVEIVSDNIKLEGYTTINGNFKIDTAGNMECKNAKMTGAQIIGGMVEIKNAIPDIAYFLLEGTYQSKKWTNNFFLSQQFLHDEGYDRELVTGYNSTYDEMRVYLRHRTTDKYEAEMRVENNQARVEVLKNDYGCGLDAVDGFINISDKKAKENIENIDEKKSLNIITKLEPVEFNYKKDEKTHRGLIAQDVIKVLNDNDIEGQVYSYNEEKDLYSLNYIELIPDLINCVKYQQKEIDILKKEIKELKGGKK